MVVVSIGEEEGGSDDCDASMRHANTSKGTVLGRVVGAPEDVRSVVREKEEDAIDEALTHCASV